MSCKPPKNKKYTLDDLMSVMKDLRTPVTGCPWDLEQDFQSIVPHTIEEAYEVADAISRGDMDDLREELGDLLFQSVYHAQMADEKNLFNLHDVISDVTAKMISRHPHVFDDEDAGSAADVNEIWDRQKDREQSSDKKARTSVLDAVPKNFPALLRAQKLTKCAAKIGFEWTDVNDVLDKVEEEIAELRQAIANKDVRNEEEELGDVLFVLANYARMRGVIGEEALRKACDKFEFRFRGMEGDCLSVGLSDLSEANLDQMTSLWDAQKKK